MAPRPTTRKLPSVGRDELCTFLVIEFVPKTDSQVQRLLSTREDIFQTYTQPAFLKEFSRFFTIERSDGIPDSDRTLYLMRKKERQAVGSF